jgi:hypothetical protein
MERVEMLTPSSCKNILKDDGLGVARPQPVETHTALRRERVSKVMFGDTTARGQQQGVGDSVHGQEQSVLCSRLVHRSGRNPMNHTPRLRTPTARQKKHPPTRVAPPDSHITQLFSHKRHYPLKVDPSEPQMQPAIKVWLTIHVVRRVDNSGEQWRRGEKMYHGTESSQRASRSR